jgi:hypothetical protein
MLMSVPDEKQQCGLFNHGDYFANLVEGDERLAQIVSFMRASLSVVLQPRWCQTLVAGPYHLFTGCSFAPDQ